LLFNKWGEEDVQNTMMGYQELRYLHHHQIRNFKGEQLWLLQLMQFAIHSKSNC